MGRNNKLFNELRCVFDLLSKDSPGAKTSELNEVIDNLRANESFDYVLAARAVGILKFVLDINFELEILLEDEHSSQYITTFNYLESRNVNRYISEIQKVDIEDFKFSNNNDLLESLLQKVINNIAQSKRLINEIEFDSEYTDTVNKIILILNDAENVLKSKLTGFDKYFDNQSHEDKISEYAEEIYNSYLLLYKLNEIKDDSGKLLKDVISEAIDQEKEQVEFLVKGNLYKVNITEEDDDYRLEVLGSDVKPEVKDVLRYTDKDVINLWAQSKVSVEIDENDNLAFAIHLRDQSRLQVGGLGKKIPFALRFANFYKVIEILKDEETPLKEKLRVANNIATGSGKTGDIALLKFLAYLTNIPCITAVPNENLRIQSNNFDREFLPDEVAQKFAEPFSGINDKYATTTFAEAFNTNWNVLNNTYGKNEGKSALILIDEAPKLKENAVQMARAFEISKSNPTAFFSATPDAFLSEEFKIKTQILLSPKERAALGISKLPTIFYEKVRQLFLGERAGECSKARDNYISPTQKYIFQNEITHSIIDSSLKQNSESLSSQEFLDAMQLVDSSINKKGLIITNEAAVRNAYDSGLMGSLIDSKLKERRNGLCKKSYLDAIKKLNTGLSDKVISKYIDENLGIPAGYSESLRFIPLHGLIDVVKAFLAQKSTELSTSLVSIDLSNPELKNHIGRFIKAKYDIDNCDYFFSVKNELTDLVFNLIKHIKDKSGDTEYIHSIKRNYTADKKLNADIMQVTGVQGFCDYYRMISCFTDSEGKIKNMYEGRVSRGNGPWVKETTIGSTNIQNSEKNVEILFNMFKAGLIGNFIADKKMGIGVDDVTLDKVVCITEGPTDLLDPAYELQVLGRGGRSNREGTYFFYRYTDSDLYFAFNDVTKLCGKQLKEKFEQTSQNYLGNEQANIEMRSVGIFEKIAKAIWFGHSCFSDVKRKYGVFSVKKAQEWYLEKIEEILVDEFNDLNKQYYFHKDATVETFINILQKIIETEGNYIGEFQNNYYQKARYDLGSNQGEFARFAVFNSTQPPSLDHKYAHKVSQSINDARINVIKNAINGLQSSTKDSNSYWSCVAHAPVLTQEEIVNNNPSSTFPIFMEQKERLQEQHISIHNVAASTASHTANKSPQHVSMKKKVMYGIILASPFLAIGIYALVTGGAIFNPITATAIFVGTVIAAAILFMAAKIYEKKAENQDMEVGTAVKEAFSTLWSSHKVAV